ncbi:MAG: rod shape-determining protein MreD [Candidatus Hinthialibacter antarcticus]|nr:rod shape-determining protein MreD [Candidatus Hinthialibacter antarcticus]
MASALIVVLGFGLNYGLRALLSLDPWTPDILLMAVAYLALTRPRGEAYVMAFAAGLLWDLALLDHIGSHSLLYIAAVAAAVKMKSILWAQYAVSRLVMGYVLTVFVRFGEVIFWLSFLGNEIPFSYSEYYILWGPLVTGVLFAIVPWRATPIQLSGRTPQMLFSEKTSS